MASCETWNIIVCGDFDGPIVILVPDPNKWTLTDLKKTISEKIHIPVSDLTLYCNEEVIPEDKPLQNCAGLKNGVGVVAAIQPFVINVYSPDRDATLKIEIPKRELKDWDISMLRETIRFRYAFTPPHSHILAVSGRIITDGRLKISGVCEITHNCLMTYTGTDSFSIVSTGSSKLDRSVYLPFGIDKTFASTRGVFGRKMDSFQVSKLRCCWTVFLQGLEGSKTILTLDNPEKLSIFKLREAVRDAVSVPTHQQRLVLGDTVLEDWDEEGRAMLVTQYHGFYDGITLYLLQLAEAIHVNLEGVKYTTDYVSQKQKSLNIAKRSHSIYSPKYINIPNPAHLTLGILGKIVENCLDVVKCKCHDKTNKCRCTCILWSATSSDFVYFSDKPVSSVEWITDGCTLTLKNRE